MLLPLPWTPAIEAVEQIAPFAWRSAPTAAWVQRNGPIRLVLRIVCQKSSVRRSSSENGIGAGVAGVPALLTRKSSRPSASIARLVIVSASPGFDTFPGAEMTLWPSPFSRSTWSRPRESSGRWFSATVAPQRAKCSTVASPMPEAPPVTSAVFPERSTVIMSSPFSCHCEERSDGAISFRPRTIGVRLLRFARNDSFVSVRAAQHVPRRLAFGQGRDAEQIGHRLARLVAAAQLFGIVGDADRVIGKRLAVEIGLALLGRREIVDLQLDPVVIGVAVVHRGRDAVVNRPMRQDAVRLQPAVGRQQFAEVAVAVRDVVGAGAPACGRGRRQNTRARVRDRLPGI